MKTIIAVIVLALCSMQVSAHDKWANGDPIPAYVKDACCGVADSHHLTEEQVHVVQGGYRVDGYKEIVPADKMQPSPDGEYWIFYRDLPSGDQSIIYCFFGPLRGA